MIPLELLNFLKTSWNLTLWRFSSPSSLPTEILRSNRRCKILYLVQVSLTWLMPIVFDFVHIRPGYLFLKEPGQWVKACHVHYLKLRQMFISHSPLNDATLYLPDSDSLLYISAWQISITCLFLPARLKS